MTRRDNVTFDLFSVPQPAAPISAGMDYRSTVSRMVSQMLDEADTAGMHRADVAAECSRLVGKDISKYMVDAYSSPAREDYNAPAYLMPALESACATHAFSGWIAEVRGGQLLIGAEALNAELGRLEQIKHATAVRIRDLKRAMGEHL